jgi:pyridoxamine 5'-phosphate oxidase
MSVGAVYSVFRPRLRLKVIKPIVCVRLLSYDTMSNAAENKLKEDLGALRVPYHDTRNLFLEEHVNKDPVAQFKAWFDDARAEPRIKEPNSFCLATCGADGQPSARILLLKGYSDAGE